MNNQNVDLAKVTDLELIAFRLQFENEAQIVQNNLQAVWREFHNRVNAANQKKSADAETVLKAAGIKIAKTTPVKPAADALDKKDTEEEK
jgi:hypothetical protein